jgi:hypothetical protein
MVFKEDFFETDHSELIPTKFESLENITEIIWIN